jgi:hypothetical protein
VIVDPTAPIAANGPHAVNRKSEAKINVNLK